MAQLRASPDRPLLSVGDRQGPVLRARRGHSPARTTLAPVWQRRLPAQPEGEARPGRPLASLASRACGAAGRGLRTSDEPRPYALLNRSGRCSSNALSSSFMKRSTASMRLSANDTASRLSLKVNCHR
jgi:hypothetical protein